MVENVFDIKGIEIPLRIFKVRGMNNQYTHILLLVVVLLFPQKSKKLKVA